VNQNPYAPPIDYQAAPAAPARPGEPQPWSVEDVLRRAWEIFKRHWPILVLASFVSQFVSGLPGTLLEVVKVLGAVEEGSVEYWALYGLAQLVGMIIGAFLGVGLVRIFVSAARGGEPRIGDLFGGVDRFLPYLATSALQALAVTCGMLLCIVPGVILALGLSLSHTLVVDAGMGPIQAMRESWRVTRGQKTQILVFALGCLLVALIGLLACCIGVLASAAVIGVAFGIVYVRLTGRQAPAT
jgi:uncharacterized membrane protein